MKNFILLAGVAVIVAGGAYVYLKQQNGQNPFGGTTSEQAANSESGQINESGTSNSISGVYCQTDDADRTLVIHKEEGSPDITFGVSYWFANTHNCTVAGEAQLTDQNSWLYSKQKMDGSTCQVRIQVVDNNINITEEESCSPDMCGALAELGDASFTMDTKYAEATKDNALGIREQALCP